jgi:uncharacterized protein YkuJ
MPEENQYWPKYIVRADEINIFLSYIFNEFLFNVLHQDEMYKRDSTDLVNLEIFQIE